MGTATGREAGWTPFIRLYLTAVAFAMTIFFWSSLSRVIGIVILAAFTAVALDAGVRTLQRLGLPRRAALGVIVGSGVAMFAAGVLFAVPAAIRQLAALARATPGIAREFAATDTWQWVSDQTGASDGLVRAAQSFVTAAPSAIAGVASTTVGTAFDLLMVAIAVLFLLTSGGGPMTLLVRIAPGLVHQRAWDVVAQTYESIGRYVIGAIAQATIAGVTVGVMLAIVDVPYAIALGIVTFFWDVVPMIGSTIAAIPCVAVAFASQGLGVAIFVAVFITLFTQFENTFLQHRIQGRSAKVPPAAIFFSILVGSALFGLPGAILAIPAASVVKTILQHWFEHRGVADLQPPMLFDEHGRVVRTGGAP